MRGSADRATCDIRTAYPDLDVALVPFLCVLIEGAPRALEHEDIRWVNAADFRALDWAEADLPIAAAYFATRP